MKDFTLELLHSMSECGVDSFTIRVDTAEQAFDTALHLVELGLRLWSSVHECEAEYDGALRRWWQGNGELIVPCDGGSRILNVIIATHGQVVQKAA